MKTQLLVAAFTIGLLVMPTATFAFSDSEKVPEPANSGMDRSGQQPTPQGAMPLAHSRSAAVPPAGTKDSGAAAPTNDGVSTR